MSIAAAGALAFRDYEDPLDSNSGPWDPDKPEIREVFAQIDTEVSRLVFLERYYAEDRVPGVTNDLAALQAAAVDAGRGGCILFVEKPFLDSNWVMPDHLAFISRGGNPEQMTAVSNYSTRNATITLGPNGRITPGNGCHLGGFTILQKAIVPFMPADTHTKANALIAAMTGTAIGVTPVSGVRIEGIMVLGFEKLMDGAFAGNGRWNISNFRFDCIYGMLCDNSLDSSYWERIHGWPYATVHQPGIDYDAHPETLNRPGRAGVRSYGFKFINRADGWVVERCLDYGHDDGFVIKVPGLRTLNCWSDYMVGTGAPSPVGHVGYDVSGNTSDAEMIGCVAVACEIGCNYSGKVMSGGVETSVGKPFRVTGGTFNALTHGVAVLDGDIKVDGILTENTVNGIYVSGSANSALLVNNIFKNGFGISLDVGAEDKVTLSNNRVVGGVVPLRLENVLPTRIGVRAMTGSQLLLEDWSQGAPNGPQILMRMAFQPGAIRDAITLQCEVEAVTVGGEAVRQRLYQYRSGAKTARWDWPNRDGYLVPVPDNLLDIGAASNRIRNLFLGNNPNVTSDQRLKTNIQSIPDDVLDAWGSVEPVMFQYRDAVAEKGETGARIHFGYIAQAVRQAFEDAGLDAFRYGLIGWDDEFRSETVVTKKVVPRTVLLRQAPVAEATYMPDEVRAFASHKSRLGDLVEVAVIGSDGEPVTDEEEVEEMVATPTGEKVMNLRYAQCAVLSGAFNARERARLEARIVALEAAA